jgi:glycosyltransferase involved in cell wall biosynthesis
MKYKIAIIIPFYNSEKFIKINIANILELLRKFKNIEVIYIDNNSTDNTYKFIKKNIINYNNIKLLKTKKKNCHSPGIARDLGVLKSNSEFILYLDVDDIIKTKNFGDLINQIDKKVGNIMYLKKISEQSEAPYLKYNKKNLKIFFRKTINMQVISILIKKKFLIKNKIFFFHGIYEDILYLFKCHFFNKKKIIFFNKIIYEKKFNKNSITNSKPSIFQFKYKFEAWKNIYFFLKKNLTKEQFKKIFIDIQYRWRGELANEYIKILKSDLNLEDKKKFFKYIIKKYEKFIIKRFALVTTKDIIVHNILSKN